MKITKKTLTRLINEEIQNLQNEMVHADKQEMSAYEMAIQGNVTYGGLVDLLDKYDKIKGEKGEEEARKFLSKEEEEEILYRLGDFTKQEL